MQKDMIEILAHQLLDLDGGALRPREKAVIERIVKRLAVSHNLNVEFADAATPGERLADRVAAVGVRGRSSSGSAW